MEGVPRSQADMEQRLSRLEETMIKTNKILCHLWDYTMTVLGFMFGLITVFTSAESSIIILVGLLIMVLGVIQTSMDPYSRLPSRYLVPLGIGMIVYSLIYYFGKFALKKYQNQKKIEEFLRRVDPNENQKENL